MARRFSAIIIITNVIMSLLLYLSSQSVLIKLSREPVTVEGVDVFSIYKGWAQVGSSPVPTVVTSIPNFPFYVFLLYLIVNAYFIIKLHRSKDK
jgi:hypothetical protein